METKKPLAKLCSLETICGAPLHIHVSGRIHCNSCGETFGGPRPRKPTVPPRQ
jgi:hypothetical protein